MELRPYDEKPVQKRSAGFFWWSILLLLLSGACFTSWLGSFYVIGHPENPKCYRLLKKLHRLKPPKSFAVTKAPPGEFLSPTRLLDRYGKLGRVELERENANLLRDYLTNYSESTRQVTYVIGKYDVVQTYPLSLADLFPSGVAVVAQAIEFPQVILEMMFTAPPPTVPVIRETFPVGSDLPLERTRDLFALLHVDRRDDGRMQFTAVPLPYGGWQRKDGASFTLMSPEKLEELVDFPNLKMNIDGSLPVIGGERLERGLEEYAAYRRKTLASTRGDQAALSSPEILRFEVSQRDPEAAAARVVRPPQKKLTSTPEASPTPPATPAVTPAPPPAASRYNGAASVPVTTLPPRLSNELPPAVPLPPRPVVRALPRTEVAAIPSAVVRGPDAPGADPPSDAPAPAVPAARRRVLTTEQASAMVEDFDRSQQTMLAGEFVVTGVGDQRVALRTRDSLRDAKADPTQPGTSAALIVVDYPPGTTPPAKDVNITRTGEKPFEIREVVRARDGQITIIVREPQP